MNVNKKNITKEQNDIIHSTHKLIKIQALSGYGKTYTVIQKCIWHIKQSKDKLKILYLTQNSHTKKNAINSFEKLFKNSFKKYKSKSELSFIDIKTPFEFSRDIMVNKIGNYEEKDILDDDIYNFLYTKLNIKYSDNDIKEIQKKLNIYYKTNINIATMINKELENVFEKSEKSNIFHIYNAIIIILEAQNNLAFSLDKNACLKIISKNNLENIYFDIVIIDDAQDVNLNVLEIFFNLNSNIKILAGNTFAKISNNKTSINAINSSNDFVSYPLSASIRLPNEASLFANKVLSKISSKARSIGNDKNAITDIKELQKHHLTYIYRYDASLLIALDRFYKEEKLVYLYDDFIFLYKDFIAMSYIQSDFDDSFLSFDAKIDDISKEFLKFKTLKNYIEISKNIKLQMYYNIISKWTKSDINLFDRIKNIQKNIHSDISKTKQSCILAKNTTSYEFDYIYLSDDFIDYKKIDKENTKQIAELKLLYLAISRCKIGFYIK